MNVEGAQDLLSMTMMLLLWTDLAVTGTTVTRNFTDKQKPKQNNPSVAREGTSVKIPKSFAKNATYLIH